MRLAKFFLIVSLCTTWVEAGISEDSLQIVLSSVREDVQSPGIYNIGDQIFGQSNYIFLPYDDWGVKGVIRTFDLPVTALTMNCGGLRLADPVYGQVPLTWLNPRFDQVTFESNSMMIKPNYFIREKVFSRFDYYRGDYGFKNFSLLISGRLPDSTTIWRFVGENVGYDSYYGVLGANPSATGESISQTYRLDLQTALKNWRIDLNTGYQKYLPGYVKIMPSALSAYLLPSSNGNIKEYRASLGGLATKATESDSVAIGFQQANFNYGQYVKDARFGFKGVADQSEFVFYYERQIARLRLAMKYNPISRSVTLRNGFYERQNLPAGQIGIFSNREKIQLGTAVGAIGRFFDGEIFIRFQINPKNQIGMRMVTTYAQYPLIYRLNFAANRPLDSEGYEYRIGTVDFQHFSRRLQLGLTFNQVNADFYVPHKTAIDDTTLTYHFQNLDAIYLTANGRLTLPWRMTLTARSLFSNNKDGVWLQGWGQIRQEIDLFKDNLRLYVAGEMTYWDSNAKLAWFEELRNVGNCGTEYFTNNRLNLIARIGGHIGDFHIFYVIYNAEGRAFATIPGMNYRNRLKVFGVEWQFLD
ncbi:MAG: hypothetical protein PHN44_00985 [Candidatus Marinimicrobia bacterium]|nr:hypothetical protein [Candidatus Neomarinimicrobiota bacterium]